MKYHYVTFKHKEVDLYNQNKQFIRRFRMKSDVVNAQVQKAGQDTIVAITTKDGKTYVYKSNGQLLRY